MKTTETRSAPAEFQVRQLDGGGWKLAGYAAVFDVRSENLGGFVETIAPGFFADVLRGDTRLLFDHDPGFVMGRTRAGNLKLAEDTRGLQIEGDVADTQRNRDYVLDPIQRGDLDQMSFGFRLPERGSGIKGDDWDDSQEPPLRTLLRAAELPDVSVVTFPAYPQTSVDAALRSLNQWRKSHIKPADLADADREILEAQAMMRAEVGPTGG